MRTAVLGVLLGMAAFCGAPLLAQQSPQKNSPAKSPKLPKRLFVDSIVASINDSSILQSKLFTTSRGAIRGAEAGGQKLSLEQIRGQTIRDLRDLIGDYQMAQSARSFGNFPPDRFDMILKSELDRDQQDRVRDLGTNLAFSEELARTGQTWQTYADSLRIEKLKMLADQFAIFERLRKQSNLYLTPRMLRETYEQFRTQFVREVAADVAIVMFRGPNAVEDAVAAAEHWRTGDWTAREVAQKFPGSTPLLRLPAKSLDGDLKKFALDGPSGNISAPIPGGNGMFRIAKVMRYTPASNGRFENPEVQARVREIASRKVLFEFRMQALKRAQDRTEVWIYENGRRVSLPMR